MKTTRTVAYLCSHKRKPLVNQRASLDARSGKAEKYENCKLGVRHLRSARDKDLYSLGVCEARHRNDEECRSDDDNRHSKCNACKRVQNDNGYQEENDDDGGDEGSSQPLEYRIREEGNIRIAGNVALRLHE